MFLKMIGISFSLIHFEIFIHGCLSDLKSVFTGGHVKNYLHDTCKEIYIYMYIAK